MENQYYWPRIFVFIEFMRIHSDAVAGNGFEP